MSEFRLDYANILEIGSDQDLFREKLDNMYGNFVTKSEGTSIFNALTQGINEFDKKDSSKYIVILTDAQDAFLKHNSSLVIQKTLNKKVKICSIGFGSGTNNVDLANVSNATGCKFYSASNANDLNELFEKMGTEIKEDLVDVNNDKKVDGILLADSGFIVNRDGFSFENYSSNFSRGDIVMGKIETKDQRLFI